MVGVNGGRRAAVAAAAVAVIAGLVPFVGRAGAASAGVDIRGSAFLPSEVHVSVGDSVTWTNFDSDRHTVHGGPMASPEFAQGGSFTFTFGEAGVFSYICRLHTFMTGSVVVDGAGAAPAAPASAPAPAGPDPLLPPSPAPAAPAAPAPAPTPAPVTPTAAAVAARPAGANQLPLSLALGLDADPLPTRRGRTHHHPHRGPSGGRRRQPAGHHHRSFDHPLDDRGRHLHRPDVEVAGVGRQAPRRRDDAGPVQDRQRREGVRPRHGRGDAGGRAGGGEAGLRLQRGDPRTRPPGRRGRQGADGRQERPALRHRGPLARDGAAQRPGRGAGHHPAADHARGDLHLRVHCRRHRDPLVPHPFVGPAHRQGPLRDVRGRAQEG